MSDPYYANDGCKVHLVIDREPRLIATAVEPGVARDIVALHNACEGIPTAALEAGCVAKLVASLEALLWPNVPSGDDVALLIRMNSSTTEASEAAMEMADKLRTAQANARSLLALARGADAAGGGT